MNTMILPAIQGLLRSLSPRPWRVSSSSRNGDQTKDLTMPQRTWWIQPEIIEMLWSTIAWMLWSHFGHGIPLKFHHQITWHITDTIDKTTINLALNGYITDITAVFFLDFLGTRTPILSDLPADGWVQHQGRGAATPRVFPWNMFLYG